MAVGAKLEVLPVYTSQASASGGDVAAIIASLQGHQLPVVSFVQGTLAQ
ncbi:hypothetical protein ACFL5O_02755 [Myxococcota bacterium]